VAYGRSFDQGNDGYNMNKISRITRYLALIMMPFFIVSCGSDDSSLDSALSGLTLYDADDIAVDKANLVQEFSSTKLFYAASVAYGIETLTLSTVAGNHAASISVTGQSVVSGSNPFKITLLEGANTLTVMVTAEEGGATQSYTIIVTRAALSTTDATLSGLTLYNDSTNIENKPALGGNVADEELVDLIKDFEPAKTGYSNINVAYGVESLILNSIASNTNALITVTNSINSTGATISPIEQKSGSFQISLQEGKNTVYVTVTAEDGVTQEQYILTVYRADEDTINANLTLLKISNTDLLQSGSDYPLGYNTSHISLYANTEKDVESVTVRIGNGANFTMASFSGHQPKFVARQFNGTDFPAGASSEVTVTVTAVDTTYSKTYTFNVTRDGPDTDPNLSGLTLDGVPLDSAFSSDDLSYIANVDYSVKNVTLRLFAQSEYAQIAVKVNGPEYNSSGRNSRVDTITLIQGTNIVDVRVTAQSGDNKYYKITVNRAAASADATLSSLRLSSDNLSPAFSPGKFAYTADVDYSTKSLSLTLVANNSEAEILLDNQSVASNTSHNINLDNLETAVTVKVTSKDGRVMKEYTLTVTREEANTVNTLSSLELRRADDQANLVEGFASTKPSYTVSVDYLTTNLTLNAIATAGGKASISVSNTSTKDDDSTATTTNVTGNNPFNIEEGVNTVTVTVTSESGQGNDYTITVTRADAEDFAQQAYLKASDAESGDQFGHSVALEGETLLVGAPFVNDNAGAVYVFTRSDQDGSWSHTQDLTADNGGSGDQFGHSIALHENTLVVGAPLQDNDSAGAAYVFTRDTTNNIWSHQEYLKASDAESGDYFGWSVAVDGNTVVVGADFAAGFTDDGIANNDASAAGAVYVFTSADVDGDTLWTEQTILKASNAGSDDHFGHSVALDGDTVVVGAWGEDSNSGSDQGNNADLNAGAVYVFTRESNVFWSQPVYLKANTPSVGGLFGHSVAVDGDTVVVGTPFDDEDGGAVYVFTYSSNNWGQQDKLVATIDYADNRFGHSVALDGDTLVVGATVDDGDNTGAVYVFTRPVSGDDAEWNQQASLEASNAEDGDLFGQSIAVDGDTVVVGASGEDRDDGTTDNAAPAGNANNDAPDAGAVYVWGTNVPAPAP
jgi:hypothetical protein